MTAETIFSTIMIFICIAPIFILGIVQCRSKTPVVFWAGKEPPRPEQITDVKKYNRKHGMMWILYGLGFIICFFTGITFGGKVAAIATIAEGSGGMCIMIAYHNKLNRMYIKDGDDE